MKWITRETLIERFADAGLPPPPLPDTPDVEMLMFTAGGETERVKLTDDPALDGKEVERKPLVLNDESRMLLGQAMVRIEAQLPAIREAIAAGTLSDEMVEMLNDLHDTADQSQTVLRTAMTLQHLRGVLGVEKRARD